MLNYAHRHVHTMRLGIKAHSSSASLLQGGDNKPRWAANHNPDSIRSSQSEAVLIYVANQKPDIILSSQSEAVSVSNLLGQWEKSFKFYATNQEIGLAFHLANETAMPKFPTKQKTENQAKYFNGKPKRHFLKLSGPIFCIEI